MNLLEKNKERIKFWIKDRIPTLRTRNKTYRKLGKKYRKLPIEPWAFIRVKNEIVTVKACLESIIPVIKKGVIGYHKFSKGENDDGTIKYLKEFCKNNPGYKLFEYQHEVIPANDERYKNLEQISIENRLDSYYNAVLNQIPKNEWLIKIDCDQIYDTKKLAQALYLPKEEEDIISLGRLNLHYENKILFYIKNKTLYDPGDHWILKNINIHFEFSSRKEENFYAWESLIYEKTRKFYNTGILTWHFPYMKASRNINKEEIIKYNYKWITLYSKLFYHIGNDMLSKEKILKICSKFDLER